MQLENLKAEALAAIAGANTLSDLDAVRVSVLGKNGSLTALMKGLSALTLEEKKQVGGELNLVKQALTEALEAKKQTLEDKELAAKLNQEKIDITLPVRPKTHGRIHPVAHVMEEMMAIYAAMGFDIAEGPDIEDDWHNFEALNIPPSHPARQMQDTFYIKDTPYMLRTQTSGVQIRVMEAQKPPVKIVAPGRCYRVDSDATHSPAFNQIEGLYVDKDVTLAHLKSVLEESLKLFFETDDLVVRFRTSYFPFTEPSYEFDVGGKLARDIGKEWIELGGCGMVDPKVLENCQIDPHVYQGFAFGYGLDRCAMLKYAIPDIRSFFEGDVRWIRHYGFMPEDVPNSVSGLSLNGGTKR